MLVVGPNLVSRDLRFNALPLYFSRPLRRIDYFLGKLGVIVFFLGAVTVVPAIVAYLLGLLFSLDLSSSATRSRCSGRASPTGWSSRLGRHADAAPSSLSRNSRYVALFWLAVWLGTSAVSGVLQSIDMDQRARR